MSTRISSMRAMMVLAASIAGAQAQTADDPHHPAPAAAQPPAASAPAAPPAAPATQPPSSQSGMPQMMGGEMGRMMQMMRSMMAAQGGMGGPDALRPFRRIEGQLAYYRTELRITDAQAPQWNAFADAMRAAAERLRQAYTQALQSAGQPATAGEQLERRIGLLTVLLETTRTAAATMAPLYATLSDEQKHTADELMAEHLRGMALRGM